MEPLSLTVHPVDPILDHTVGLILGYPQDRQGCTAAVSIAKLHENPRVTV